MDEICDTLRKIYDTLRRFILSLVFIASILVLIAGPVVALFIYYKKDIIVLSNAGISLLLIGILSFALSLILMSFFTYFSIPAEEGEKRIKSLIKLDRKEIRRSIAISFTILYIVLISFYFQEAKLVAKSLVDAPETIAMNNTTLAAQDLTLTHLSNLITAFTTVYLVIIAFYFGSRVYEKIKEIKNAEEALKMQYIMDEIDSDEFKEKMGELRGIKPNAQLEISKLTTKQITITHKSGDDIDLKDVKMIIAMEDETKTTIDPVAHAYKKDVFKEKDEMVINMKKIINRGDDVTDAIKVNDEPTGVKKDDICDGIQLYHLKVGSTVKVKLIHRRTGDSIEKMNKKIDP